MVVFFVIAIIIVILFILWMLGSFLPYIAQILVNGVLLWLSLSRAYVELIKEKNWKPYLAGFVITAVFFAIFFKNFHSFAANLFIWWETLFVIIAFILAQIMILVMKKKR